MVVNWVEMQLKGGEWVCPDHGIIQPDMTTTVPSCTEVSDTGTTECQRAAGRAVRDGLGNLVHQTPAPGTCLNGHAQRALHWTWRGCRCTTTDGHHVWRCLVPGCGSVQSWPPIGGNPGCDARRD